MSVEFAYRFTQDAPPADLRDLDVVALTAAVLSDDGDTIAAGAEGTIVSAIDADHLYVVEFAEPEGALATVDASQIRLVSRLAS